MVNVYGIGSSRDEPIFVQNRVIHDLRQVKTPSELIAGRKYARKQTIRGVTTTGHTLDIIAVNSPKSGWFRAKTIPQTANSDPYEGDHSMSDAGITPYDNGTWNASNFLVPLER